MPSNSLDTALVLIQLVALALPAVAIFMQVVNSYYASMGKPAFERFEFVQLQRALITFFLGAVAVSLYLVVLTSIALVLKGAIILFSVALYFLARGIWEMSQSRKI
jgi:uncharacterized membrane protein